MQRHQVGAHRLTCANRVMRGDGIQQCTVLTRRLRKIGPVARTFAQGPPGVVVARAIHRVEDCQKEPVACRTGDLSMKGGIPQLAPVGVVGAFQPGQRILHPRDIGGGRAEGGQLRQLRLQPQADFHDFGKIDLKSSGARQGIRARSGECPGTLSPPDQPFGLQHLQRAPHRAAADPQCPGQLTLGRQARVAGCRNVAQHATQPLQRKRGIVAFGVGHGEPL